MFNISFVRYNFETTVRNYLVLQQMTSVSMLYTNALFISFVKRVCFKLSFSIPNFYLYEKRLITKKHIVMHSYLNFVFKQALYFSTLVLRVVKSCFKLQLLPQHYEPVFLNT